MKQARNFERRLHWLGWAHKGVIQGFVRHGHGVKWFKDEPFIQFETHGALQGVRSVMLWFIILSLWMKHGREAKWAKKDFKLLS